MMRKKILRGFRKANTDKWRPVTIRDALSVKALNSLFCKGWYLMDLEMDDLPCLAFHVSLEGERPPKVRKSGGFPSTHDTMLHLVGANDSGVGDKSQGTMLVLVLTKGEGYRQRAIMLEPDEQGYRDFGRYAEDIERLADGWVTERILELENRCTLVILVKPEAPADDA